MYLVEIQSNGRRSNFDCLKSKVLLSVLKFGAFFLFQILAIAWLPNLQSISVGQQPSTFFDPNADLNALPKVPKGFIASEYAREPLVRQPSSMAFDRHGRLYVGMGQQYRDPKPTTPGDSVVLLIDSDDDGRADKAQIFATGFNSIQGLSWHGPDLWVANSPDLTIVKDLDGDDVADEYVRVFKRSLRTTSERLVGVRPNQ